ncbi:TetR/AcrR family transcriptional regulator [Agromyces silvae]|uniref:TetR/AcrR family transcriptional regulator n=1 Tax=Agromyces silvae TaxID=3388266 RepID=UPI00280AD16D|nr:TetR/AcrR family transcriptional regulator [Agromyces protaetiae]
MRPGPRRSIKQSDIVAAAFEILEQSGFAAVSIRGVAAALNLTPTAMYTYFPSKQELLSAMVEELFAGVLTEPGTGERRRAEPRAAAGSGDADASTENLLAAAIELRDRLRAHPGAVSLVTVSGVAGVGTIALIERLGQGFAAVGLPADDAARAAHAFLAHTIGQVALEQAWGEASDDVTETTLWNDEPTRPIADAGERLGLRAGDDEEFRISAGRLLAAWLR